MNYSVNLSSGQTVEVVIGEAAQINVEQALNYIESGRVEITKYVNEWAKPEIINYTKEYAEPIVTEIVNQTTKPLIDDYLNTTTKPQIDEYVADNVKPYADSAQDSAAKAKISEDNAKTSETNAKASELAAASSAGVASAAAVTATEAKDYTAKVLTDKNLKTVGQDLQSADSNIKTVATNILNVNTVAKNIDNVNLLAPHTEAMEALAPDIMDVVTVAGITEQTKNVSDNMYAVVDVSNNKTNINTVAANRTAINNVSKNMSDVKNAVQSANDAKLWAIGTKTEKPEGSSKYWAEQAKNAVQTPDATETVKGIVRLATSDEVTAGTNDSAAITPLKLKSKLDAKQDKSTAVNYNNISNCITEIPQDIKLELNNGTLTLKAGSKVYVPNGAGVFDVVTIASDKTKTISAEGKQVIFLNSGENLQSWNLPNCFSGSTAPTSTHYPMWYDTTNNIIKSSNDYGSTWSGKFSFPICVVTVSNGVLSSIDQVFNGFGYIGSIVYALPGVKGLIPNGRNADGSLKNIEVTISSLRIFNVIDRNRTDVCVFMSETGMFVWGRSGGNVTIFPTRPQTAQIPYTRSYIEDENVWIHCYDTTTWQQRDSTDNITELFSVDTDANKICGIYSMKSTFHALDYNESSRIVSIMDTKVNKSGDTMTGVLFINKNTPALVLQDNTLNLSQTFTAFKNDGFILQQDKNGNDGSHIVFSRDQYDSNIIRLVASNGVDQDRKYSAIGVWVRKDGLNGTFAPQCNLDTSIVTTVSHGSNYIRFGNGLQICWGSGTGVQTFPQPFKDANYMIADSDLTYHKYEGMWTSDKTTTQFKINNSGSAQWIAIGYWY